MSTGSLLTTRHFEAVVWEFSFACWYQSCARLNDSDRARDATVLINHGLAQGKSRRGAREPRAKSQAKLSYSTKESGFSSNSEEELRCERRYCFCSLFWHFSSLQALRIWPRKRLLLHRLRLPRSN